MTPLTEEQVEQLKSTGRVVIVGKAKRAPSHAEPHINGGLCWQGASEQFADGEKPPYKSGDTVAADYESVVLQILSVKPRRAGAAHKLGEVPSLEDAGFNPEDWLWVFHCRGVLNVKCDS